MSEEDASRDLWLFGYGSLIWKPPPHYDLRVPGFIQGFVRRFWQASEDHRGTPEAPGRVVTLLERGFWQELVDEHSEAPDSTWGTAYRIPAARVKEVRDYLDLREINGYSMKYVPFYAAPSFKAATELPSPISCLVYIGLPNNPQFVGPQDPQLLAEHIITHKGPSGENKDYLYGLDKALRELSEESGDEHVHDLTRRCQAIEARDAGLEE